MLVNKDIVKIQKVKTLFKESNTKQKYNFTPASEFHIAIFSRISINLNSM